MKTNVNIRSAELVKLVQVTLLDKFRHIKLIVPVSSEIDIPRYHVAHIAVVNNLIFVTLYTLPPVLI
jgi:hypothetical protein